MENGILQKRKAFIGVYGCQMNLSDAERMEGQLGTLGYERTDDMTEADLLLRTRDGGR